MILTRYQGYCALHDVDCAEDHDGSNGLLSLTKQHTMCRTPVTEGELCSLTLFRLQ